MSTSIDALIPELQEPCRDLVNLAGSAGVQPRITSTLRSHSEQVRLYNRYLAGQSAYPAAPPGRSAHEFGYAFDMIVVGSENQHDLGSVWQSWGGVYSLSDDIHFEYPGFVPPDTQQPATIGSDISLDKILDFGIQNFIPGTLGSIEEVENFMSQIFPNSEVLDYIAHPSKAVARYPWLVYLGPPFIFYAK